MNNYCFISYARQDQDFAFRLADQLNKYGLEIWIDRKGIKVGSAWRKAIEDALRNAENMIFVLSPNSLESKWVQHEGSMAYALKKTIFPIMIEKVLANTLPVWMNEFQYINFTELDFEEGIRQLVGTLNPPDPAEQILEQVLNYRQRIVLIIGNFSGERSEILRALKNSIRSHDLLPVNIDVAQHPELQEMTKVFAEISLFVIADITNSKLAPQELMELVPRRPIPFVPIVQEGERPFAMLFDLLKRYSWVLDLLVYDSKETLQKLFKIEVIDRALAEHQKLKIMQKERQVHLSAKDLQDDQV